MKAPCCNWGPPREIYEQPNSVYVAARLGHAADQPAAGRSSCPDLPLPSGRQHGRRPDRTSADFRAWRGRGAGPRAQGRTSRRPDTRCTLIFRVAASSPSPIPTRSFAHDEQIGLRLMEPLYFDAEGKRIEAAAA